MLFAESQTVKQFVQAFHPLLKMSGTASDEENIGKQVNTVYCLHD